MRIIKREIDKKTGSGHLILSTSESEDMYHLYNVIAVGDEITCTTTRNVSRELASGMTTAKSRITLRIAISIEKVEFDADQCSLRVLGRNLTESPHIKKGQYHTIELLVGDNLVLAKQCWDRLHLELLQDATDILQQADIAAISMQEGLAHICLVKSSLTVTCARIQKRIAKKKDLNNARENSINSFLEEIFHAVKKHVDFARVKVVLVGSRGFLGADFMTMLTTKATATGDTALLRDRSKFLLCHASSGRKVAIEEMLGDPAVQAQMGDVKAAGEAKVLHEFYQMLSTNEDQACYGLQQVEYAKESLAIDSLLISDTLYRAPNPLHRRRYQALLDAVKENNGKVYKFSSRHVTGAQLDLYTGIAAILRFPLPEMQDWDALMESEKSRLTENAASEPAAGEEAVTTGIISQPVVEEYDEFDDFRNGVEGISGRWGISRTFFELL